MAEQSARQRFVRFSVAQRYEHFVLIVVFFGLAVTGMAQKFASEDWARWLINVMGGIEGTRIIHRFLAVLLIGEAIYHVLTVVFKLVVLRQAASMRPGMRDLRDLRDWVAYNLGQKSEPPSLPRYHFGQKAMYLGAVIGTLILIMTGFMLWNPIATAKLLPGAAIPGARIVHSSQALLALLVIVTWHLYSALIWRFNASIFTGKLSRRAMMEQHAEELAAIERGDQPAAIPAEVLARRRRRFWPAAMGVVVLLVGGLYWFITFEETAIKTVPRQEAPVIFAPPAVPETGDAEVGAAVWATSLCALCHGQDAAGGAVPNAPGLRGTDLTYDAFYIQVREGGEGMPAFGAGEIPDAYLLDMWAWLTAPE